MTRDNNSVTKSFPMQIDIYLLTGKANYGFHEGWVDVSLRLKKMGYSVWDDYSHHGFNRHNSTKDDDLYFRERLIEASKCLLVYDYRRSLSSSIIYDLGVAIKYGKPIIVVGGLNDVCLERVLRVNKRLPWVTVKNWEEMMKHIVSICGKQSPVSGAKKIEWRNNLQHPDDPIPTVSNRTDKWGYSNKEGKTKCRYIYQLACEYSDGMAMVKLDNKFGFLGMDVRIAIEPQYEYARDFNCGLAPVAHRPQESDSKIKWGYIDKKNNLVIPFLFDDARCFEDCGLARVNMGRKYGLIDTTGELVLPLDYDYIVLDKFSEEKPGIINKTGLDGFVNTKGEVIISPQYERTFGFAEGVAACKKDGEWCTIDLNGNRLVKLHYDEARYYSEGLLPVAYCIADTNEEAGKERKKYRWGFCDKEGNEVIPCEYDKVLPFSEGYAAACFHGKWGYIDHKNRVMIPFQYSFVADGCGEQGLFGRIADGIAKVGLGGPDISKNRWGFFEINKLGQEFDDDGSFIRTPVYEREKLINRPIYNIIGWPREALILSGSGIWPKEYYITNIMAALMKHRLEEHPEEKPIRVRIGRGCYEV